MSREYEGIYPIIRKTGTLFHEAGPVVQFLEGLDVIFVKKTKKGYQIVENDMLPIEYDGLELYHGAIANLAEVVDYVVAQTPYGGFAIIADDEFEASAILFKQIWQMCSEKLNADIFMMLPTKNTLIFVPQGNDILLKQMKNHAQEAYQSSEDKISLQVFEYVRENEGIVRVKV